MLLQQASVFYRTMDHLFIEYRTGKQTSNFCVYFDAEYLKLTINEKTEIDLQLLKQLYRVMKMKNSGQIRPTIILLQREMILEKEAREYINKISRRFIFPPIAVISETFNETLMANFYKNFYKLSTPYKVFKKEGEAFDWLKKVNQQ